MMPGFDRARLKFSLFKLVYDSVRQPDRAAHPKIQRKNYMKMPLFTLAALLALFAVMSTPAAAQAASDPQASAPAAMPPAESKADPFSSKADVEESIKSVPCDSDKRLEGVRQLFISAGAPEKEVIVEKLNKGKISNVVVRIKGETDETVVVGAHYDRTSLGCGVTDNWSGVTILAHAFKTLRTFDTKKSYIFVAFDQEELGLRGSKQMLKEMPETEFAKICSMVNFDSFGQGYPMALRNASSSKMLKLAEELGDEAKLKFKSVEIAGASSDSESFRIKGIPAITLSGLSGDWQNILHSSSDKIEKVNSDSVYLGYRFGLMLLSRLDAADCRDFK